MIWKVNFYFLYKSLIISLQLAFGSMERTKGVFMSLKLSTSQGIRFVSSP